jgi:hypothetical protein
MGKRQASRVFRLGKAIAPSVQFAPGAQTLKARNLRFGADSFQAWLLRAVLGEDRFGSSSVMCFPIIGGYFHLPSIASCVGQ